MTFSLAGRCARTGMFGIVVTSSSPAVAARCAWARGTVGAVSSQNITDPSLGPRLLDLLEQGRSAQEALDEVTSTTDKIEYRQLSVVDAHGGSASFSGSKTLGLHLSVTGTDVAAAGNLLSSDSVPQAMVDAFQGDPEEHIGDRLLAALRAGSASGGEEGPVHSCGIVIVDRVSWPVTDLRVDWADDPITDLEGIWQTWKPQAEDYLTRAVHPETAPSYGVPGDL